MDIFENFLSEKNLRYSKRISIKRKGNKIDRERYTYCFSILNDNKVMEIMNFITDNEKAKRYIIRRNNSSTSFIVSFDSENIKFYLDSGFKTYRTSMFSIEFGKNETEDFRIKTYTPENLREIPQEYEKIRRYLYKKTLIVRSDGQRYIRFEHTPPKKILLEFFSGEEEFFSKVEQAVWFQFSENSYTFYFTIGQEVENY